VESVLKAPPMTSRRSRAGPGPGYPERLPLWVPVARPGHLRAGSPGFPAGLHSPTAARAPGNRLPATGHSWPAYPQTP